MNATEAIRILSLMPKQGDAIKMAIEALEKQVGKKPIKKPYSDAIYYYDACPTCEEELYRAENRVYCPYCGQHIDWSEEETENG